MAVNVLILNQVIKKRGRNVSLITITRVAPKLMPPVLLCWPMTSKADVGDMAVEVEPLYIFKKYLPLSKTCCYMFRFPHLRNIRQRRTSIRENMHVLGSKRYSLINTVRID